MQNDLHGAHIVVTGGSGILGRAVVAYLVKAGANCYIPNLNPSELADFPETASSQVQVSTGIDLTNDSSVIQFYASLPPLWASIHIAGGFDMSALEETSLAAFEQQLRMNTLTCFLCMREAVRSIRRRVASGDGIGGRIVNIAARPALEPRLGAGMAAYTASKAGVAALTQALGEELAGESILINAVAPSIIHTPANVAAMPSADHDRWPRPAEIAEVIGFLASVENRTLRSAVIPVYGRS